MATITVLADMNTAPNAVSQQHAPRVQDGIGLAFSLEEYVAPHLASGALVRVLENWCSPFAGFFP
jgi:hypothetical protein